MEVTKNPNIGRMKDRLVILERIVEKMIDTMYQHGEKVYHMETEVENMKHGFNEAIREF
jgi:hypothetical protein